LFHGGTRAPAKAPASGRHGVEKTQREVERNGVRVGTRVDLQPQRALVRSRGRRPAASGTAREPTSLTRPPRSGSAPSRDFGIQYAASYHSSKFPTALIEHHLLFQT
jgi:hypothetical protein